MLAHTPLFQQALARPHSVQVQVRVLSGGQPIFAQDAWRADGTSIWFGGGSVRISLASRVTRLAKIAVDGRFYATAPGDLFAPFGNELQILRGVTFGDGTCELHEVFTGPITGAAQRADGMVNVSAADRAIWVLDAGFLRPWRAGAPNAGEEFRLLVSDAVPDAVFAPMGVFGQKLAPSTWEDDRGQALDDVCEAAGAVWLCTAGGWYLMSVLPWAVADPPVLRTLTGAAEGGTLAQALGARSRDDLFNATVAFSEPSDGEQPPLHAVALDHRRQSPTWIGGAFRRKLLRVQAGQARSPAQLRAVAEDHLARGLTWTETFTLRMTPDPTLELGDAYRLALPGRESTQIVTSMQMPLDTRSLMSVATRSPGGVVA